MKQNYEIACHTFENASTLAKILIEENYVVLLSKEEQLWIVNFIWSENNADRNDVVFMRRDEFEEEYFKEN